MTATIYERGVAREASIWGPFTWNGPFNTDQQVERAIVFGLYANTYLYGHNYLSEIETEDLARLVAAYNAAIAKITNDEAVLVLEIAAKRYLEAIDQQIHDDKMTTRQHRIDSLNDEYDAKTDALAVDQAALVTKQQEVQLAWDKADQRIKELETQIELETLAQSFVDVEILEKELAVARADLKIIEAGLQGLDIQLAITQAGLDYTNTELAITNAENEVSEVAIKLSEIGVQESNVDLDITNAGIATNKAAAQGRRIQADTVGVAVKVANTELGVVQAGADKVKLDADTSKIEADTSKLGLVDTELSIEEINKRIALAENGLLVKERGLLESKGENIIDETELIEAQEETQVLLDGLQVEHEDAKSDAEVAMSIAKTVFENNTKDMKIGAFNSNKELADSIKVRKVQDADDRSDIHDTRADSAEDLKDAAITAARDMADANIINTLTHSIGQA